MSHQRLPVRNDYEQKINYKRPNQNFKYIESEVLHRF